MHATAAPTSAKPNAAARTVRAPEAVANRRAAFVWSAVFSILSAVVAIFCTRALDPSRRLHYFRQSALEFIEREEWRQAALQLGNVVQLAPQDAQAWFQLGLVELRAGSLGGEEALPRAVRDFRRAVELDPNHWQALRWLLELQLRAGDWEDARAAVRRLAALQPEHSMLTLAYDVLPAENPARVAELEVALKTAAGAQACAHELANGDLSDGAYVRVLALAYRRIGAAASVRRLLEDVDRKHPRSGRAVCLRAELAVLDGDYERAATTAAEAFGGPCDLSARLLAAEAHERLAELDPAACGYWAHAAAEDYRQVLAVHANHDGARRDLAYLLNDVLGRRAEAAALGATASPTDYRPRTYSTSRMKEHP